MFDNRDNIAYAYIVLDVKRYSEEITKYIISSTEDRVSEEEINNNLKYKGKFILISSKDMNIEEVVPLYYTRQKVENMFGILKNNLNLLPLRVNSIETFRGYIFFNFLCLIIYLNLQNKLKNRYTTEDFILTMNNLKCKVFKDNILVQEKNRKMKEMIEMLKLEEQGS